MFQRPSRTWASLSLAAMLLALAACSTTPPSATSPAGSAGAVSRPRSPDADGPPVGPQPDPMSVADATPQVEPIRPGGPNKPYEVAGQTYVPLTQDVPLVETGLASWYGGKFHGRRTASGEVYNMHAMTAAHKTMPLPSFARVRNIANGREVIVRVNDRGPFVAGRIIDLSYAAAMKLGTPSLAKVEVQRLTNDEIRALAAAGGSRVAAARSVTPVAVAPSAAPNRPSPATSVPAQPPQAFASTAGAAGPAPGTSPANEPPKPSGGSAATAAITPSAPMVVTTLPADAPATTQPDAAPVAKPVAAPVLASAELPGTSPDRGRAFTPSAAGFWLQLGAFGRPDGAMGFHQKVSQELAWLAPLLAIYADGPLHRLQAGPYASRDEAREAAEQVRSALQLVPLVIERR